MRPTPTFIVLFSIALAGCGDNSTLQPDGSAWPLDIGGAADAAASSDTGPQGQDALNTSDAGDADVGFDEDGGDVGPPIEEPPEDPSDVDPDNSDDEEDATEPDGSTVSQRNYRVLHWNIAGGKENACRTDLIARAVRRLVKEKNVQFVGLNEVCPGQHNAIESALRAEWGLGRNAKMAAFVGDGTGRIVGNGIYSKFPLTGVTRQNVGQDQYGARNLLCAKVADRPHLRFCSTHLTPADSKASDQLKRVVNQAEDWWKNRGDTVILSGDINLKANHPGMNVIYAAGANSPNNPGNNGNYREADDNDPQHCLGYGERSLPNVTGGPCNQGGKIDFVFARRNRIVNNDYSGDTLNIPTDCTGICSDHRPVFGRFKLKVLK